MDNNNKTSNDKKQPEESVKLDHKMGDKAKKGIFAGASFLIIMVIIVSVLMTMSMQKNNTKDDNGAVQNDVSDIDDDVDSSCKDNTTLSSGSVTTNIDGRTVTYSGSYVVDGIEATICSGNYESTNDNQVVFLVINGGSLKIEGDVTIGKSGSENFQGRGDDYSFYGTNSAIVVVGDNSSVSVDGAKINTNVSGANAVVATNGGRVLIEDSKIFTTKDNSRGLHATYRGRINADDVEISTQGGSSASLATDRGEGTLVVDNMTLSTAGAGSPLIYSTGNITVTDSTGTSTGAQIAVVEGKNSITIQGCDFSANGTGNRNSVDNAGVMIYQSMSGDAGVGTGSFMATDSKLTVLSSANAYNSTPFFFVTNTNATIDLTSTTISFSNSAKFISAVGTSEWGRNGSNGGNVTITMTNTTATNNETEIDSISNVTGL